MASCCYLAPIAVIDLLDPCVCNMPGGGVLALSNGDIYVRITVTVPCNLSDWQLITGAACTCSFNIQDAFTNTETVNGGDLLTILGQNGVAAVVTPVDTIVIDGLTTFSNGVPVAAPAITTEVNMHLDCLTSTLYVWCPTTASWLNVSGNFSCLSLSSCSLNNLGDVQIIAPVVNQILSWDGTDWININFPSIDAHSDVDTTTIPPVANQILTWDNTNWVPAVAICPAITSSTVHYGFDGTNYGFFNARQKLNYRSVAVDTALIPATDGVIGVDASIANRIVTLVAPNDCEPQDFWIKRIDNVVANTVTINAISIDGVISVNLTTPGPFSSTMGETIHIMHIGSNNWIII